MNAAGRVRGVAVFLLYFSAFSLGLLASPAHAAGGTDPDWPCIQRKVPHLSIGQMWAGAPIAETELRAWRTDDGIAPLARALAARRTTEEEAEALIAGFAAAQGPDRNARLALLFAGAFTLIERERSDIIAGIGRYARTQARLAETIETIENELTDLNAAAERDLDRIEELEDRLVWDRRIYKDRAQSLSFVCETPVILERRAFMLGRLIQTHLD